MGTGSFPGVKSGRGVTLTSHPLLMPWSWKSIAIPLLPPWAARPVHSLSACTRVHFTLSSNSCLLLLPRLPVTFILPSIFPPITCFERQFLRNMWPIQSSFLRFVVYRILVSSLTPFNISSFLTRSVQLILPVLLQHQKAKLSRQSWSISRSAHCSALQKLRSKFIRIKFCSYKLRTYFVMTRKY